MQLKKIKDNKVGSRQIKASDVITSLAIFILFISSYYQLYTKLDEKLTKYAYDLTHKNVIIVNMVSTKEKETPIIAARPISITIPSLNVTDLDVVPGGIVGNNWVLFDNKATYLQTSGLLGEGYNTIIYAHNRKDLFKGIENLNIGDKILSIGDNNRLYRYSVFEKETVNLKDVSKLKSTTPNIITLFTCDGPLDENRVIVRAQMILE